MGDTADLMRAELDEIARVLDGVPTSMARAGLADQVRGVVEALEEARAEILALNGREAGALPGWRLVGWTGILLLWRRRVGAGSWLEVQGNGGWHTVGPRVAVAGQGTAASVRDAMRAADAHVAAG